MLLNFEAEAKSSRPRPNGAEAEVVSRPVWPPDFNISARYVPRFTSACPTVATWLIRLCRLSGNRRTTCWHCAARNDTRLQKHFLVCWHTDRQTDRQTDTLKTIPTFTIPDGKCYTKRKSRDVYVCDRALWCWWWQCTRGIAFPKHHHHHYHHHHHHHLSQVDCSQWWVDEAGTRCAVQPMSRTASECTT